MSDKKCKVIFVNHNIPNCGVYQFGKRLYEQVAASKRVDYSYVEAVAPFALRSIFRNAQHIVFNWHKATMPALTEKMIINRKSKHYFIFHEETMRRNYDKYFFFGDYDIGKRVPKEKSVLFPRPLFKYKGNYPTNEDFTIGSFGFGFWNKGFHTLVERVNQEFKKAVINFHIPYSHFGDPDKSMTHAVIAECRKLNTNPNIKLNITQSFLTNDQILAFLAKNDMNAFLYSDNGEGLSSAVDYALSVNRPMVITDCLMFRHFKKSEICIESSSILDVYNRGLEPLAQVRRDWATENLVKQMDEVFLNE